MAWSGKDLQALIANLGEKGKALNPELFRWLQEEDLKNRPWTADPLWEEKEDREIAATQARIVRIKLRQHQLLVEYEERFGRPYYG